MFSEYIFLLANFMALLTCSREIPTDLLTGFPNFETEQSNHLRNVTESQEEAAGQLKSGVTFPPEETNRSSFQMDHSMERENRSRMLLRTSTLGYEEWWYLTTKRPPILSYKDFPGRPGVATWKEISPGATVDIRKSRQMDPTAVGVTSNSWSFKKTTGPSTLVFRTVWILLFLYCVRWTSRTNM